jgi:hypothetical protein
MAEQSRDPWRILWRFATSNEVLVALLLAIAASVTLAAWIPQRPSSDVDYARWLSETQARFGEATSLMRTLDLFSIVSSFGFRALLALLSGCIFLRVVEGVDRLRSDRDIDEPPEAWRETSCGQLPRLLRRLRCRRYRVLKGSSFFQVDRWPWSGALSLTAHLGVLLLLISLLLWQLLGWQAKGLILQRGERRSLPGGDSWVSLAEDGIGARHSPGVVAFIQGRGPGVQVSAVDRGGKSLQMLLSSDAEPSTELRVPLTGDTYFAIPEAELVVRLTPRSEVPYARADVQIYSSPTGEIISERVTEKGGQATFEVGNGVGLTFVPAPYAHVLATHNPGRLPAGLGLVMLMVGLVGSLAWSERRFWLREKDANTKDAKGNTKVPVEAAGSFPSWLQPEHEG